MKKLTLLCSIITLATAVDAQSLKDALYGGKLKSDSGTVVRKTDDLSTKIDTIRKKPVEPQKPKATVVVGEPTTVNLVIPSDTTTTVSTNNTPKDNTKVWNAYVDAVVEALKTEVLNSKKVKKGDYNILVDYAIDIDGKVSISNIFVTPESKFLAEQVKERLSIDTPVLSPVLSSNGKPRKANKRTSFNLSKG